MKLSFKPCFVCICFLAIALTTVSMQVLALNNKITPELYEKIPGDITTPDKLDLRIGQLKFNDGVPSQTTIDIVHDNLDFMHAEEAFLSTFQGASTYTLYKEFQQLGITDNSVVIWSNLLDAKSLFLTANADVIYFWSWVDLTHGPMVVEAPPGTFGIFDDIWDHWVSDFGLLGPDRGEGGKYLILPPDYDGQIPEGGYFVVKSRTTKVALLGYGFLVNNDPKPTTAMIKKTLKIYPYSAVAYGTSIATVLDGKSKLDAVTTLKPPTKFIEGSDKVFKTIPPNDYHFFEVINELIQQEPATASYRPELTGHLAAIGIVKGKPFQPDARMKKLLTEAAAAGTAAARVLNWQGYKRWAYYPGSAWTNMLFEAGDSFEMPPAMITKTGIKQYPMTGARALDTRSAMFFLSTGISPTMCMRLPNIGMQFLVAMLDSTKNYFDGARTYKLILPPNIPHNKLWSVTVYDNQSRSMLQTPQHYPRVGNQNYPTPAASAKADGSTEIFFGPKQPDGVNASNWIQTVPHRGFFVILRIYDPLQSFFDKTWRPGEIELVK